MSNNGSGNSCESPKSLSRSLGNVFAVGAEMPTLALSECCTEQPTSSLAGDFRTTQVFLGKTVTVEWFRVQIHNFPREEHFYSDL